MISKNEILRLHKLSIEKFGGAHGIRDEGMLESATARLFKLLVVKIYIQLQ
ncbi:MAG: hypothetical protein ABI594_05205 [Ginsengibacter sp.]